MKLQAKQLMTGDIVTIRKADEVIESITRRDNHVYIETNYTRETGSGAYDFDKMRSIEVSRTTCGTVAAGII